MIDLVAWDRADGLLFYREGSDFFSLRPPFGDPKPVSEAEAARAIDYGFEPSTKSFPTVEDMLDYVRASRPQSITETGNIAPGLLRIASRSVLEDFLTRAETELPLNKAHWLVRAMLDHSPRMQTDTLLLARAEALLGRSS